MKNSILINQTMNDVIFENRNQSYGAYYLRLHYESIMSKAMFYGLTLFVFIVSFPLVYNYLNAPVTGNPVTPTMTPVILFENNNPIAKVKEVFVVKKQNNPPSKPQIKYVAPTIIPDDSETEERNLPTIDSLKGIQIGVIDVDTAGDHRNDGIDGDIFVTNENGKHENGINENTIEVFNAYAVQQQPEFPNGITALYAFLQDHLKYPLLAKENGIEGTVFIQFIVSVNGAIADAKILRGVNGSLDKEALRVVNLMPAWKPGKHNGNPVPVIFVLPIKFQII